MGQKAQNVPGFVAFQETRQPKSLTSSWMTFCSRMRSWCGTRLQSWLHKTRAIRIGPGETKLGEIKKKAEPFLMPRDTYSVSKGVMIHVVMSGRNGAVQPFFVDSSVKMDAKQYQNLLRDYVVPHIYAGGYEMDCFRFQHDGAPAHSAKIYSALACRAKHSGLGLAS